MNLPAKLKAETRSVPGGEFRLVAPAPGSKSIGTLVGRAVVYNSPSVDLGGFVETIRPGAFAECLKTSDLRALIDHDTSLLIGREKARTLRLIDGPEGLDVEIDLPDVSFARDLVVNIKAENLDGMSFLFVADQDEWADGESGPDRRTVIKARIFEVSAVTFPAYLETTIGLRSHQAWVEAKAKPAPCHRRERLALSERLYAV